MRINAAFFGIITALTLGFAISVAHAAGSSDLYALWTCSTDTETRTLSVGDKDAGCELHYEKNGSIKVISWSTTGTERCVHSRDKIVGDFKKAGWKCTKTSE
jgi:hypothetical protein